MRSLCIDSLAKPRLYAQYVVKILFANRYFVLAKGKFPSDKINNRKLI